MKLNAKSQSMRSIHPKVFCKKGILKNLKILQSLQKNTFARVSFLIKLQAKACNFIKKEALAQVLSCGFCEIFKNIFYRRPPVVAFEMTVI